MKSKLVWMLALPITLLVSGAGPTASASPLLPTTAAADTTPAGEAARIQAHLETVERELLARDVSHLPAGQRAARAHHIRVLREYRERGVFPHNHDFPGERVPYFVDEHGTLCAVAYLISRSGRDDLVERVAAARNNARIPELAGDAELVAWLHEAGLSLEEAARIQPMYGCCWIGPAESERVSTGYAVASALTSGVGGVSIGLNLSSLRSRERSRWSGALGMAAGTAGLALGLDRLDDGGAPAALGAATAGIGVLSTALGAWTFFRLPEESATDDAAGSSAPSGPALSVAPLLPADSRAGLGVLLRMSF